MQNRLIIKTLSTGINFILTIILGILVPKAIGPEAYGNYNYIISTFGFIVQFLMFSSISAYVFFLSNEKYKIDEINLFYNSYLLITSLLVFTIGLIIIEVTSFSFLWNGIESKHLLWFGLLFSVAINIHDVFISFADSTKQTVVSEKIKLISKFVIVFSIVVFIYYQKLDIEIYFILMIFNFCIFYILFYFNIDFKLSKIIDIKNLKPIFFDFLTYIKPLIVFSLIAAFYAYYGKFVIQSTNGSLEQGYYNFAFQLAMIPITFISALMTIYMSEFTKSFKENDLESVKNLFSSNLFRIYIIHFCISLFIIFNSEEIILITVGEKYFDAKYALEVLALYSLFQTLGMFSRNIYFSSNRTKEYSMINSIVMLFGIGFLTYILFKEDKFLAYDLAIIMTSFYLLRTVIQLYRNLKFLEINYYTFLLEFILINIITIIGMMAANLSNNIFIKILLSIIIFLILNFIFKDYFKLLRLQK